MARIPNNELDRLKCEVALVRLVKGDARAVCGEVNGLSVNVKLRTPDTSKL